LHEAPHNVIMRGGPVETLLEPPAVDDVADQIHGVAIHAVEKIDQHLRVASARAKMDVRYPDRAIATALAILPFREMWRIVETVFEVRREGKARNGIHGSGPGLLSSGASS